MATSKNQISFRIIHVILCVCILFQTGAAQSSSDYAVKVSASIQLAPLQITLNWPAVTSNSYTIYKKSKSATTWGTIYASLPGTAIQFTDTLASVNTSYEYKIVRNASFGSGYGYINSGIELAETENKGKVLLISEKVISDSLASEIRTLVHDMEMDGWLVKQYHVLASTSVDSVKGLLVNEYQNDSLHVKAVFLLGHVPVPYSGNIAPDGHSDHLGAWPADGYYGDMNGLWTDLSVNNTSASDPRNDNIPGDGKFDQSYFPSDLELSVGRVDFSNLPGFSLNEISLLRNYLNRNHAFRNKQFTPVYRAVVDDNFGAFGGEAFAASAFKNFAPLVGSTQIISADYRTSLDTGSYIWSYGCGGGSYTSCGGVGTSADLVTDSLQTIFTMLFGSYFGDWDRSNNLMRTALAQGSTLSISWSGRPHWIYHHMALGEHIGYDALISQNNTSLYHGNSSTRMIHVALLGDPTLRMHYVAPPDGLTATTTTGNHVALNWTASADSIIGYHIYRRLDSLSSFTRINQQLVTGTQYTDSCVGDLGIYQYMIRALKLQESPSGSYFNLSGGISDTATVIDTIDVTADFAFNIQGDTIFINANNSGHATSYFWTFGDGGQSTDSLPVHIYQANGNYVITLYAFSVCDADTVSQTISITTGANEQEHQASFKIYPVPSDDVLYLEIPEAALPCHILIANADGKTMIEKRSSMGTRPGFNLRLLNPGFYHISIFNKKGNVFSGKFIKY